MGSNEAGERRAGEEETLLRLPDGLIHPCTHIGKHMPAQTRSLVHSYSAKVHNHIGMHMGAHLQWRYTQISSNTNSSLSQVTAIKLMLCESVSVCSGWQMKRR